MDDNISGAIRLVNGFFNLGRSSRTAENICRDIANSTENLMRMTQILFVDDEAARLSRILLFNYWKRQGRFVPCAEGQGNETETIWRYTGNNVLTGNDNSGVNKAIRGKVNTILLRYMAAQHFFQIVLAGGVLLGETICQAEHEDERRRCERDARARAEEERKRAGIKSRRELQMEDRNDRRKGLPSRSPSTQPSSSRTLSRSQSTHSSGRNRSPPRSQSEKPRSRRTRSPSRSRSESRGRPRSPVGSRHSYVRDDRAQNVGRYDLLRSGERRHV